MKKVALISVLWLFYVAFLIFSGAIYGGFLLFAFILLAMVFGLISIAIIST